MKTQRELDEEAEDDWSRDYGTGEGILCMEHHRLDCKVCEPEMMHDAAEGARDAVYEQYVKDEYGHELKDIGTDGIN